MRLIIDRGLVACSHHEIDLDSKNLIDARVDTRRRRLIHGVLANIADDSDDGKLFVAEAECLSDGILIREVLLCHRLIDHERDRRVCAITCGDRSRPESSGIPIALKKPSLVNMIVAVVGS